MNKSVYEDLLHDVILEVNEIAMDRTIWVDSDFNRGYRAGLMVMMKAIDDEIKAFGLENCSSLPKLIDVDKWFREGREFTPPK